MSLTRDDLKRFAEWLNYHFKRDMTVKDAEKLTIPHVMLMFLFAGISAFALWVTYMVMRFMFFGMGVYHDWQTILANAQDKAIIIEVSDVTAGFAVILAVLVGLRFAGFVLGATIQGSYELYEYVKEIREAKEMRREIVYCDICGVVIGDIQEIRSKGSPKYKSITLQPDRRMKEQERKHDINRDLCENCYNKVERRIEELKEELREAD